MKILLAEYKSLIKAKRWDIDFHLPAEGIKKYSQALLKRVDEAALVAKDKRDPTAKLNEEFQYVDISCIDVTTGDILNPQELLGSEAPSRARKVVQAFDIVVSTCRPTRGAIAIVPERLHDQIASTGFSILRPKPGINPFYLHYALRLQSTLEQFRKWSTGSSYPAILDEDVAKTLIPLPDTETQDKIAKSLIMAHNEREEALSKANYDWAKNLSKITQYLYANGNEDEVLLAPVTRAEIPLITVAELETIRKKLPAITVAKKEKKARKKVKQKALFSEQKLRSEE